jgi:hypothetical protein
MSVRRDGERERGQWLYSAIRGDRGRVKMSGSGGQGSVVCDEKSRNPSGI